MKEFLFFIIGLICGGFFMTIIMSIIQINKINEIEKNYKN